MTYYKFIPLAVFALLNTQTVKADDVHSFLKQHCLKCHGSEKQEAELRLDMLASPNADNSEIWSLIVDMLESGDMPPQGESRPNRTAQQQLLTSISHQLSEIVKPSSALRRMNRTEYEYTVQDLLGIKTSLSPLLPEDGQIQGFDNVAGGLGISSILMERYLEAADLAFEGTIRRIKPLPPETRRAVLMDLKDNIASVNGNKGGVIESAGAFVDFTAGWPPSRIDPAHPIEDGIYRCRVAVWPHDPGEQRTLSVGI
ncbi:MAG TPA: hypothetical protein DIW81_27520, partial [Planctomycetaceae bacterium]|nr:hypothetical protein [Planctomycetaceae bacterium]